MKLLAALSVLALSVGLLGCEGTGKESAEKAKAHIAFVVRAAKSDVGEVRRGLPQGAKALSVIFKESAPEIPAATIAREALLDVRARNNDLDSAKSTFFLIAAADGFIIRNNLDQDEMAEKNLFQVYPSAKQKRSEAYFEFTGAWDVARGVNGRVDEQWVAAAAIPLDKDPQVGFLVAGWSWSAYAYRLEMALRSDILGATPEGHKVPLIYVYVLAGEKAFGAPVSPPINGQELLKLPARKTLQGEKPFVGPMKVERHEFGVAMQKVPELGDNVILAVLRSET